MIQADSALDAICSERGLTGLLVALGGLSLAPLAVFVVRHIFPGRNVFFARWGFSHVLIVLAVMLVFGPAISSLLNRVEWLHLPEVVRGLIGAGLLMAGVAVLIVSFAQRLDPDGWRSLGLWPGRNLRAIAAGCASYVLLWPAWFGLMLAWPWVFESLGGDFELQAIAQDIIALEGPYLWLAFLAAAVTQPLLEELLFRAFLQPLLVQNVGDVGGIVLTSIVFALLHGASSFLPIFALSLLLGAIMLRTQRLLAVWAVHGLHNALSFSILFASS